MKTKRGKYLKTAIIAAGLFLLLQTGLSASVIKDDIMRAAAARAVGMGGAFAAISDDWSAFYWNPAGLVQLETGSASVFFDSVLSGKETGFGANCTYPLFSDQTAAFTYIRTNYSDSAFYNDFFYFTYAGYLHEDKSASFGVNFKLLSLAAGEYNSGGFAASFDAAVMIYPQFLERKMRIGLVAQDLDTVISWSNNIKERVPVFYKAAASYEIDKTAVAALDIGVLDYGGLRDSRFAFNIGGEKWFRDKIIGNFAVRAGWQWREGMEPNSKLAIGASYSRDEFVVNYVYMLGFNNLGDTHKLDFSWYFFEREKGGMKPAAAVVPSAEMARGDIEIMKEKFKAMQFDLSRKYLSPNADKKMDTVDLYLNGGPAAAAGVSWKVEIANAAGVKVKEIKGQETVQPAVTWDGTDSGGGTVKDGDYTVTYSFEMDKLPVWSKARVVTVDTIGPRFKLSAAPKTFAPSKKAGAMKLEVKITPSDRDIKSWKLQIRTKTGSVVRRMSGEGLTERLFWQGEDALGNMVKDGAYEVVFEAEDFASNTYELAEQLTVDTYITKFRMIPDTGIFKIGKESVIFESNARDTDRIKTWDLEIRDTKGNLIKSFRNNAAALKSLTWDGQNDQKAAVKKGNVFVYRLLVNQKNGAEVSSEGYLQSLPPDFEGVGIDLTLAAIDFPEKSKDIPVGDYGYLNQAAEAVKKYAKNYSVIIKGYATDNAGAEENLQLSIGRIKAIKEYLLSQGVPEEFIYTNGYGDGSFSGVAIKDEAAKNGRRVEVKLLTK